jgi:hypothetical protein
LAAAIAVWGIGMNVDMAIAPMILILPALWLVYRPSLRLKPLLVTGAVSTIVWFPYLRFEGPRDFVDLRSQLLLQHVLPANYMQTWCDPKLTLHDASEMTSSLAARRTRAPAAQRSVPNPGEPLLTRTGRAVSDPLLSNFDSGSIPGARVGTRG